MRTLIAALMALLVGASAEAQTIANLPPANAAQATDQVMVWQNAPNAGLLHTGRMPLPALLAGICPAGTGCAFAGPITLPSWTTTGRPATTTGTLGVNTTTGFPEIALGGAFQQLATSGAGFVSMAASGAVGNGSTDDTAAINTFLAGLTNGTTVYLPAGKFYLINSGNLVVPAGIRIEGSGRAIQPGNASTHPSGAPTGSGFIINPAYTILMNGTGAQLDNLGVWRSGLIVTPTAAQVESAVAQWGTEQSVGVTVGYAEGGVRLSHLFIEGFNLAVQSNSGEVMIDGVWGDDYNGIEELIGGDNTIIKNCRFEPYYAFGIATPSLAWDRPGVAYEVTGGTTGPTLQNNQSFMWQNGILADNSGGLNATGDGMEYNSSVSGGAPHGIGVRFINANSNTTLSGNYIAGFAIGVSNESGEVQISGGSISGIALLPIYVGGGVGVSSPPTITISGTPAPGDTVTETVTAPWVTGSPVAVTYTAVTGDTTTTVARGLARAVNLDSALMLAHVSAGYVGGVETTTYPAGETATITAASTGGITVATGTGTAVNGGPTQITAVNLEDSDPAPIITLGDAAAAPLTTIITAPLIQNGTASLPAGWLSVPSGGHFGGVINLVGIQWSYVQGTNLSACGAGANTAPNASDGDGTITEGTNATGCTLTFTTPFYRAPDCTLSSPTGSLPTGYTTSTTALVITNASASGDEFTYHCRPH